MSERLFTPRFFIMCAYTFTVFVSVFQLLPTAPYHVLDLGGGTTAAGLFLGFLTYSSAISAPFTGSIGDRIGQRRVLITVSLVLSAFTASYAFIDDHRVLLGMVIVHGLFWSGLLTASGAYMTSTLPPSRRAEGLGYWGLASVVAVGAAPVIGFWVYSQGWTALCVEITTLNLLMAVIAWRLPDDHHGAHGRDTATDALPEAAVAHAPHHHIEWRVLLLSVGLALISFAYGSLTSFSALYADWLGISPRSLFLSAMAVSMLFARLLVGRSLDRIGHRRVLLRCLVVPPIGLALLAFANGPVVFAIAAMIFGVGFGLMHPAFTAYVMNHVSFARRGAAYGAMIAAFDTGIGTGSSVMGWLVHHAGYRPAFGLTAALAALSLPSFLFAEERLGFRALRSPSAVASAMNLRDAHCHFFSAGFFRALGRDRHASSATPEASPSDTDAAITLPMELQWDAPGTDEGLAARWITELDRRDVAQAVLIASTSGDEHSVANACALHPDRFVGAFMFNPLMQDAVGRLETALVEHRLRMICLFPAMHHVRLDDEAVGRVFSAAARHGAAVFVHCGALSIGVRKRLGLPCKFDLRLGDPLAVAAQAVRHPSVPVVIPHFGSGLFREALMAADAAPNIRLDTSSSNNWIRLHSGLTLRDVFTRALDVVGPSRLLFGTDSSFFPRGWQQPVFDTQKQILDDLNVPAEAQARIFGDNLAQLFPAS